MPEQVPFGSNDFAENPEPRVPCVLLLDTSGSMHGEPINALNAGLTAYKEQVSKDPLASKRVEVAVVTFGPATVLSDFTTVSMWQPPVLTASGDTPLGEAVNKGIDMVADRKQVYRSNGIAFYRPWIFLITDGAPNPSSPWREAAERVKQGEKNRSFAFFGVGTEGADFEVLKQLCDPKEPLKLNGVNFRDMFLWLSHSQQAVTRSQIDESVSLANPTGPKGWATIG